MNAPDSIEKNARVVVPYPGAARRLDADALAERRRRSRRATFIKWLRKVHGWIGLWGAALGLLFGITGVLLNHRAPPMKIPTGEPQVTQLQLALPSPAPATPAALADWVRRELKADGRLGRVRKEPAQPVAWGERRIKQPERWQFGFFGPSGNVQAEYWVGNGYVSVKRTENGLLATMNNLHRGTGMNLFWILLTDTIAGSIMLLSLTGVLLWTELNKRRTIGVVLVAGSIAAALAAGFA
ncbi:PepSY-associated TM helix domain-containing protein [Burkholderia sp. TSV86]|uniref:PepSY-associated TM helix domain-containing protein n=1 Tax=Burkholderia sp. TSV86 TaxID=1385594 RepID=UPI00075626FF|nr:PepSY-associated TM helix domain-containing protein [Burkholderia sp. TSV86]KVE33333.1 peptidase [Burkholderia sp. TSV86]